MTQDRADSSSDGNQVPYQKARQATHYALLGLHPSASVRDIRQAYRDLSKLYHPDTTGLPAAIATQKFQELNEAYATLSNPERRLAYDHKIGYSRVVVAQALPSLSQPQPKSRSSSAYLDPTDRPLSAGELFALFILGITFVACLILAITIGITRGEQAFEPLTAQKSTIQTGTQPSPAAVKAPPIEPNQETIKKPESLLKDTPPSVTSNPSDSPS